MINMTGSDEAQIVAERTASSCVRRLYPPVRSEPLLSARPHDVQLLGDLVDGFAGVAPADNGFIDAFRQQALANIGIEVVTPAKKNRVEVRTLSNRKYVQCHYINSRNDNALTTFQPKVRNDGRSQIDSSDREFRTKMISTRDLHHAR